MPVRTGNGEFRNGANLCHQLRFVIRMLSHFFQVPTEEGKNGGDQRMEMKEKIEAKLGSKDIVGFWCA